MRGCLILTEASVFDLMACGGRWSRVRAREAARQVSEGAALTVRTSTGELVCVMGLWPEADHAEAWLAAGPGLARRLLAAIRVMRRALETLAAASGQGEVRAYVAGADVAASGVAGARMASWLGFVAMGEEATAFGPVTVFVRRFEDGPDHG